MKYTINNIRCKPHDLQDDIAYFYFDIYFTEPEEMRINDFFYPFSDLLDYIKEKHPSFYQYIEQTRTSIDAWGPCEVRTIDALGDEALQQLYDCLREHLLHSDWIEKEFYREQEHRSKPVQEQQKIQQQAAKALDDFSSIEKEVKREQNCYYRFCETVEKKIRETCLEVYPEIADLEPEKLKEFKYLFVRDIQQMEENLTNFLQRKE